MEELKINTQLAKRLINASSDIEAYYGRAGCMCGCRGNYKKTSRAVKSRTKLLLNLAEEYEDGKIWLLKSADTLILSLSNKTVEELDKNPVLYLNISKDSELYSFVKSLKG